MAEQLRRTPDDTGLHHLALRPRNDDSELGKPATNEFDLSRPTSRTSKRFPHSLQLQQSSFRPRSPTQSSIASSISSAVFPDSATTHSASTLNSPLSSSYASEVQELFAAHNIDDSIRCRKSFHRYQPSSGSSFTFVNEEEDERPLAPEFGDIKTKLEELDDALLEHSDELEDEPVTPTTEASIKEECATPCASYQEQIPEYIDEEGTPKCESASVDSDDLTPRDADGILDYTLQLIYGMDLQEAAVPSAQSRNLVDSFVRDIGRLIWQAPSDSQMTSTMSGSSSFSTPSQGGSAGGSQRGEKRKNEGRSDEDGDELSDGEGSGCIPLKRTRPNPREEENLRLSCPFRKRNSHRFNVRDHHSCAMTYFPKFAELRQHIVKQHKREHHPSAFVCDRCNRDFSTRKELRDHQRLPRDQICDISDHDPESGIDGPTANKLLSRKRASGSSPEVQWREIWNILFPDDEDHAIRSYQYTPVIEHFELSSHFLSSFKFLEISLRDKISNQVTLETLATKFQECFAETVDRCIASAQDMPYTNRSNKRNEPTKIQNTQSLVTGKTREVMPRPDSGVVIDDGSEESGSFMGSALRHKDSVRTVISRSSQVLPDTSKALPAVPATNVFDENLLRQYSATPSGFDSGTTDAAAMQAWNNGVMMPPYASNDGGGMTEHFFESGILTPQPELGWTESFYQTNFTCLGESFSGFNGQSN